MTLDLSELPLADDVELTLACSGNPNDVFIANHKRVSAGYDRIHASSGW
jgi:hypothetical protein